MRQQSKMFPFTYSWNLLIQKCQICQINLSIKGQFTRTLTPAAGTPFNLGISGCSFYVPCRVVFYLIHSIKCDAGPFKRRRLHCNWHSVWIYPESMDQMLANILYPHPLNFSLILWSFSERKVVGISFLGSAPPPVENPWSAPKWSRHKLKK